MVLLAKRFRRGYNLLSLMKDTRLTFRVRSNLKKALEEVAVREGRSVAQVCEAFLKCGLETYKKKGPDFLKGFFSRLTD